VDILTFDWETYYAQDYSLSNMTTEAYIRDPRFEEILIGVKDGDAPAYWLLPDRFAAFVQEEVDWANTAVICHHSHFDMAILAWKHGIKPALHIDTLSMARILDGPKAGNSLHDLCIRHGVGEKGNFVTYAKGKHLADFSVAELHDYGRYCCNDCDRTYDLAMKFMDQMPMEELKIIDLTVRMFTEPILVGNSEQLRNAVVSERARKKELLLRIGLVCPACRGSEVMPDLIAGTVPCKACDGSGVDKKRVGSNEQLATLFRACGVEPKTKTSPTTGEQIYAFAKTDSAMAELLEDEYEDVRFLAEARIAIKSNLTETRAERFQHCAERGAMPVYLSFAAAHTFRHGGGDSMNWMNLSGHNEARPEMSVIKASVGAPPGFKCVRTDSSQGEARISAWCSGQNDLVESFALGHDVYSEYATTIYGRPVNRKQVAEDFIPGQLGKISILGLSYGMGWYKFSLELLKGLLGAPPIQFNEQDMAVLRVDPSRMLNTPKKVTLISEMSSRLSLNERLVHCAVAEALVQRYRQRYDKIVAYWKLLDTVINAMIEGTEMVFGAHGIMRTAKDRIWMPNGLPLRYDGIKRDEQGEATYFNGRETTRLHGPMLCENLTQCLHRIIVCDQMLEVAQEIKVATMTYDDIIAVVPDEAAELSLQFMVKTMKYVPAWAVGLPLAGEGKIGQTLLEVK